MVKDEFRTIRKLDALAATLESQISALYNEKRVTEDDAEQLKKDDERKVQWPNILHNN